ncbi:ferrochelatase, mitochondrial-like [Spodoptera litura]|uniref:Ferrochelatase, mitochondrial-like n=1 Tax=Spodoptera litura TaxID=69820 RepID=A0A9J7IZ15_SPOLT|nr:ferrochelatase, mitochondrial-like [Spodoptera litura]
MLQSICRNAFTRISRTVSYATRMAHDQVRKPKTAIVMLNMGGPTNIDEVGDYLHRIMTDRDMIQLPVQSRLGPWIASRRTEDVQKKYSEIGGGSPILKWTNSQGHLLVEALDKLHPATAPHKHYVCFRYVPPFTHDAFNAIESDGVERAVIFSQYPQYSCATTGSSLNAIADFYKDSSQAVSRGDTYPHEVAATVANTMLHLNVKNPYRLVWQSKVGPLPWLQPYTDDAIKAYAKQGKKNLLLVPIAFVNEHIETLHELDIEYCHDIAKEAGITHIERAATPNAHPTFIAALADIVVKHLTDQEKVSKQFLTRCPHCVSERCNSSKQFFKELCGGITTDTSDFTNEEAPLKVVKT